MIYKCLVISQEVHKFLVTLFSFSSSSSWLFSASSAHLSLLKITASSMGCRAGLRQARAWYTGKHTPSQNPTWRRGSSCLSSLSIMGIKGADSSAFSRSPWYQNSSATIPAIWYYHIIIKIITILTILDVILSSMDDYYDNILISIIINIILHH